MTAVPTRVAVGFAREAIAMMIVICLLSGGSSLHPLRSAVVAASPRARACNMDMPSYSPEKIGYPMGRAWVRKANENAAVCACGGYIDVDAFFYSASFVTIFYSSFSALFSINS